MHTTYFLTTLSLLLSSVLAQIQITSPSSVVYATEGDELDVSWTIEGTSGSSFSNTDGQLPPGLVIEVSPTQPGMIEAQGFVGIAPSSQMQYRFPTIPRGWSEIPWMVTIKSQQDYGSRVLAEAQFTIRPYGTAIANQQGLVNRNMQNARSPAERVSINGVGVMGVVAALSGWMLLMGV